MRILMIVQKPQRRGAEVFASQLSTELRRIGHTVNTIYLYPYTGDTPLELVAGDQVLDGQESHFLERIPGIHPSLLRRLCHHIQTFQPDIVQVNGARTVKYGAFAQRLLKGNWQLIYRNIDNPAYWVTDPLRRWFYQNLVMPHVDGIVGVSQITLENVRRMYGDKTPAVYIPNGIAVEPFANLPDQMTARRQLRVDTSAPVVLFMGNLTRQKRPDRFVRVVGQLHKHLPNLQAWILGGGPLQAELELQVQREGLQDIVTFWGYQKEVGLYLSATDLLLVTSDSDGIPAVVLEAGYLCKPTVATNVGGMSDCICDGETGLLIEPENETGLVTAVMRLLNDKALRLRLGRKAQAWVSAHFSMDRIAREYITFYSQFLSIISSNS